MKLRMRKFNPQSEGGVGCQKAFVVLIGKRNSGKTTLLKDMLVCVRDKIDIVLVISPTDEINDAMAGLVPPSLIHREIDEKKLQRIMAIQRKQWRRGRGYELCLVLDDCAFERKFFESKSFRELAFNGRHMHITVFVTMQFCHALPPAVRCNTDVVITLAERINSNRRRLYDAYFGMLSFGEFCQVMDSATTGFECLVLWNKTRSAELHDQLFWYKADPDAADGERLGRDAFWKLHDHFKRDEIIEDSFDENNCAKMPPGDQDDDVRFDVAMGRENINTIVRSDADDRTVYQTRVRRLVDPRDAAAPPSHGSFRSIGD